MVSENCIRDTCLTISREGDFLRIVWTKSSLISGFEKVKSNDSNSARRESCDRFDTSYSRTRSIIRQYALCNNWDYFVTFTISKEKFDRFDLRDFYKSFSKYINNLNYRRKDDKKLLYVLIPEQHEDGAWHFHGFMANIPEKDIFINEYGYLDIRTISEKFGFCNIQKIRNKNRIAFYIQKYIKKGIDSTQLPSGYRFVLASKGLCKSLKLRKYYGIPLNSLPNEWDYYGVDFNIKTINIYETGINVDAFCNNIDNLFKGEKELW